MHAHGGVLQDSQPVRRVDRDVDLAVRSGEGEPHVFLQQPQPAMRYGWQVRHRRSWPAGSPALGGSLRVLLVQRLKAQTAMGEASDLCMLRGGQGYNNHKAEPSAGFVNSLVSSGAGICAGLHQDAWDRPVTNANCTASAW